MAALKQGLVMGVFVEPLPEFAGPSNEGVAFIHDYALNGWKTAMLAKLNGHQLIDPGFPFLKWCDNTIST